MDPFRDLLDTEFRQMLVGDFAEDTHVRASFSVVARVRGIFDSTYLEVDPASGATVASRKPRLTIYQNDAPFSVVQGAIVSARGSAYRVRDIQPDGFGGATLYLDPARASDTNAPHTHEDEADFPEDAQAVDIGADEVEPLNASDSASWAATGRREESDTLALDDAVLWMGAVAVLESEPVNIEDFPIWSASGLHPFEDQKGTAVMFDGSIPYVAGTKYDGGASTPAFDRRDPASIGFAPSDRGPFVHDLLDFWSEVGGAIDHMDRVAEPADLAAVNEDIEAGVDPVGFVASYSGWLSFSGRAAYGLGTYQFRSYSGDLLFGGADLFGGPRLPVFDEPMPMTVTRSGVPTGEVVA